MFGGIQRYVKGRRIDIMVLQEPYLRRGIIPYKSGVRAYYIEQNPKATIMVYSDDIEVLFVRVVNIPLCV